MPGRSAGSTNATRLAVITVPVGAGSYAPEEITLNSYPIANLAVLVEVLPATATVEVWVPGLGLDASNIANWFYSGNNRTTIGFSVFAMGGYQGAKIRVKSGGTAGNAIVDASVQY